MCLIFGRHYKSTTTAGTAVVQYLPRYGARSCIPHDVPKRSDSHDLRWCLPAPPRSIAAAQQIVTFGPALAGDRRSSHARKQEDDDHEISRKKEKGQKRPTVARILLQKPPGSAQPPRRLRFLNESDLHHGELPGACAN